jgi:hypothetical protein
MKWKVMKWKTNKIKRIKSNDLLYATREKDNLQGTKTTLILRLFTFLIYKLDFLYTFLNETLILSIQLPILNVYVYWLNSE